MASETSAFAKVRQRRTWDAIHRVRFMGIAEDHFLPYGDARAYRTGVGKVRNNFVDIKRPPPVGAKHEPKER